MGYTLHYYDLLLGGIAISLLVGIAIGLLTDITLTTSVTLAALVGVILVAHGLFIRGPVEDVSDLSEEVEVEFRR